MNKSVGQDLGLPWYFTDKPVTPWGGLRVIQEMLFRMQFREALEKCGLPDPGSNHSFKPSVMIESFMACVWIGGNRFSHTTLVRFDEALCKIFGWERVASTATFTRFFRRFKREDVDRVFGSLNRWFWEQMAPRTITVDLDSSMITRFGKQEGAKRGRNMRYPGKPGHHPLFAFVADVRLVLHAWLRPGDTGNANGTVEFFQEALGFLGNRHRVGLVRADAGFYEGRFLDDLEGRRIDYAVACKLSPPLKDHITRIKSWLTVENGIAVSEIDYQGFYWDKSRRVIVVRQEEKVRPNALGKELIALPGYKFHAFVTTLKLAPAEVWRIYNGRSDSENRILELKHDFGIDGFCLDHFYGTEAAFLTAMLAYNFMSLFRQALLQVPQAMRLSTMRSYCFAIGAWVGRKGHRKVLRISVPGKRRAWFEGLFGRTQQSKPPWLVPA